LMPVKRKREKMVYDFLDPSLSGPFPTGIGYGWFEEKDVLMIDFNYRPGDSRTSYVVGRVNLTRKIAKDLRDAIDEFLAPLKRRAIEKRKSAAKEKP